MKYSFPTCTFVFCICLIFLIPHHVFGAQLYLTASRDTASVGDTLLIHVVLDSEGEQLNAVEGTIGLDAKSQYEFSTRGSALSIWPTTPELSSDGKSMSFLGGIPDGFNSSQAQLFDVAITLKDTGDSILIPNHVVAYKNDGKGTAVPVVVKNISIHAVRTASSTAPIDEWNKVKVNDTTQPRSFFISLGKDSTVYEGKQFITFNTTDDGSGIDYYEVKEGNLPTVKSGEVYVLQNELGNESITVSAYDKAGNVRTETLDRASQFHTVRNGLVILIVCIIISIVLYRRRI